MATSQRARRQEEDPPRGHTGGAERHAAALNYYHLEVPNDIATILNAKGLHQAGIKGQGVKAAMIDSGFGWSHPYFQGKGYDLAVALPEGSDVDANGHGTGETPTSWPYAQGQALRPGDGRHNRGLRHVPPATRRADHLQQLGFGRRHRRSDEFVAPLLVAGARRDRPLCRLGNHRDVLGRQRRYVRDRQFPDTISIGGVYKAEDGTLMASDYASSFDSFRFQNHPNKREVHVPEVCGLCGMRPGATYIALPIPPGCEIDRGRGGGSFPAKDETAKDDGWGVFSGTSAACPMAAGVVALILQQHPNSTLADVRRRLYKAADVRTGQSSHGDSAGPGYDAATGYGLVDAAQAVA